MLKKHINNAKIGLKIVPIDPLLIKSGQATVGGVDMSFVRSFHAGDQPEPFIPGSSLKGMIRSYAEKICRSLRDTPVPVCIPYVEPGKELPGERRQASCGLRFEKLKKENDLASSDIYKNSCPTCKIFGSLGFAGRFGISDAYISDDYKETGKPVLEIRNGVAIDRLTGGAVGGALYDLEVLTRGEFETTIEIRNFERWQLGLIGLVVRDMEQGLLRIGFGNSRGLGKFGVTITEFKISYLNTEVTNLAGISAFCSDKEKSAYGLFNELNGGTCAMPEPSRNGLRFEYDITQHWKDFLEQAVQDFSSYIQEVPWPISLEKIEVRGI